MSGSTAYVDLRNRTEFEICMLVMYRAFTQMHASFYFFDLLS